MNNKEFAQLINNFFTSYLTKERKFSKNTYDSYLIDINQYIMYLRDIKNIKTIKLNIEIFSLKENVRDYFKYLEDVKGLKSISINHHLAVIKSFLEYCKSTNIIYSNYYLEVKDIKMRKEDIKVIDYLTIDEFKEFMSVFNLENKNEYKHFIMITILYETACRVSELINLKVEDIRFGNDTYIDIIGKGNKERIVYISKSTERVLQKYIKTFNISSGYLFLNHCNEKFTRFGLNKLLEKYSKRATDTNKKINSKNITPHVLRHTKAMHFLLNRTPLPVIQKFLGHSQISTTEKYLNVTSDMITESVNKLTKLIDYREDEKNTWSNNSNLQNLIKSLTS